MATYADNSPELLAFNREILSYLTARQRSLAVWQTNPPGFGQRRMEPLWIEHLEALDGEGGGQQSLVLHSSWLQLRSVIDSGQNLWRRLIERAGLLETPYSSVAIPSPAMHARLERERHERLAAAATALRNLYGATDDQEALRRFADDRARQGDDPAAALKGVMFPRFTARPPRTFDDSLSYAQSTIAGVPAVVSSVAGMSLAEIGLAFDLRGIPAHL